MEYCAIILASYRSIALHLSIYKSDMRTQAETSEA